MIHAGGPLDRRIITSYMFKHQNTRIMTIIISILNECPYKVIRSQR
jgi:hypothetical protein